MFKLFQNVLRLLGKLSITPVTLFTPTVVLFILVQYPFSKYMYSVIRVLRGDFWIEEGRRKWEVINKTLQLFVPGLKWANYFERDRVVWHVRHHYVY